MRKKISVQQLRVGMHIHEFCGSWISHPFWRAKFILTSVEDLAKIRDGGLEELWIDTDKGLDVEVPEIVVAVRADAVEVRQMAPLTGAVTSDVAVTREVALDQAAALCRRSLPKIAALFGEVRLGKAADTAVCDALVDEISDSVLRNPGALISVARLKRRDEYTYLHSVAVCALMLALGKQLGLRGDALRQAGLAGMLHDMGKAVIPVEILNKPGKLTEAEFDIVRRHPQLGHDLLLEGSAGQGALDVCLHHHEKIDGTGYPHGLSGDKISLLARMGAVCDVYDAVTSVRAYKDGWDPGVAVQRMASWKGHFDPAVFRAFAVAVGIYPIGSLVRLQSGRLAVVVSQNPAALISPRVKAFFSLKSDLRIEPIEIDLSAPRCQDKIVASEQPADWSFKGLDQLWDAPG
ncbi:cyclic di-GMP phosphodiesterase [soil metagenome]